VVETDHLDEAPALPAHRIDDERTAPVEQPLVSLNQRRQPGCVDERDV